MHLLDFQFPDLFPLTHPGGIPKWCELVISPAAGIKTLPAPNSIGFLLHMGPISMPDTNGLFHKSSAKGSIARAKSKGETGQPCLQPCRTMKEGDLILLVITDAYGAA